ncbi:PREDICTED: uncharacterized protein LOC106727858 [Myotis brandtii]|uniref:uncharacterized protein LOC106727858 n=1 Tax=Myotis brandtii TaxID=109478 RepID=UPI0007046664|nr:PREDICTED: uncharacterized protein LOC106727858 [Myotis brandtii]
MSEAVLLPEPSGDDTSARQRAKLQHSRTKRATEIQGTNFLCTQHNGLYSVFKQDERARVIAISSGHPWRRGRVGRLGAHVGDLGRGVWPRPGRGGSGGTHRADPCSGKGALRWEARGSSHSVGLPVPDPLPRSSLSPGCPPLVARQRAPAPDGRAGGQREGTRASLQVRSAVNHSETGPLLRERRRGVAAALWRSRAGTVALWKSQGGEPLSAGSGESAQRRAGERSGRALNMEGYPQGQDWSRLAVGSSGKGCFQSALSQSCRDNIQAWFTFLLCPSPPLNVMKEEGSWRAFLCKGCAVGI